MSRRFDIFNCNAEGKVVILGRRHIAHNSWVYGVHESEITSGVKKLEKSEKIKIIPSIGKKRAAQVKEPVKQLKILPMKEIIQPPVVMESVEEFPWLKEELPEIQVPEKPKEKKPEIQVPDKPEEEKPEIQVSEKPKEEEPKKKQKRRRRSKKSKKTE